MPYGAAITVNIIEKTWLSSVFRRIVHLERSGATSAVKVTKKFKDLNNPKICSLHFKPKGIRTTLNGIQFVKDGQRPCIFDPNKPEKEPTAREDRAKRRKLLDPAEPSGENSYAVEEISETVGEMEYENECASIFKCSVLFSLTEFYEAIMYM